MSVLDDLREIDLGAVVDARGSISAVVDGEQLTAILAQPVGAAALGSLGQALGSVQEALAHPASLLDDVIAALPDVAHLPGLDAIDLDDWEAAIRIGAGMAAEVLAAVRGDLSGVTRQITAAGGDRVRGGRVAMADYARVGIDELARLRRLIDMVEAGVPTDPAAFADIAVDVLLPVPRVEIARLRAAVTGALGAAGAAALPSTRASGLLEAYAAVTAAAEAGDAAAVRRALAALEQARATTVAAIQGDLRFAVERLSAVQPPAVLEVLGQASAALAGGRTGILEFLEQFRIELRAARAAIGGLDPEAVRGVLDDFFAALDNRIEAQLVAPVDARVRALEAWIRELLADLPLRALRTGLTRAVRDAAAAIEAADLDGPADAALGELRRLRTTIQGLDVGAVVRDALEEIERVLSEALEPILDALGDIGAAVDGVAGSAQEVVDEAVGVITSLAEVIAEARRTLDELPIEQATQQVVDTVRGVRGNVEAVLGVVELPEGLRPAIEQLTEEVRAIDLEAALIAPLDQAMRAFDVVGDVGLPEMVDEVRQVLSNLVPAQLAAELQAELDGVIEGIRSFRPDALLDELEGYLRAAASEFEQVDLDPLAARVQAPFDQLLAGFDALRPTTLLQPLLAAFDELVDTSGVGEPTELATSLITAATDAAAGLAAPLAAQVERLAPGQLERAEPRPPDASAPRTPPGDIVRLFGYLPARLRAALMELSGEARQAALDAVDALCGGLAAGLRELPGALQAAGGRLEGELDQLLAPLAQAQVRAQLAVRARFSAPGVSADASLDVDAAVAVLASAGPGALREAVAGTLDLATGTAHDLATHVAGAGGLVDVAALALERSPLGQLGRDVDAFLAALDPEPLAAELDAFVDAAVARLPDFVTELGDELERALLRCQQMLLDHNPAMLLQRFLSVLDVVRAEVDVLNPHALVAELDPLHAAARSVLASYDPRRLVAELEGILAAVAGAIRTIDLDAVPGAGELPGMAQLVERVEAAVPLRALAEVGTSLDAAGEQLGTIDLTGLVEEIEQLRPRIRTTMEQALGTIQAELVALLEAVRYQSASASGQVSVG
jgi:hypothetical protein